MTDYPAIYRPREDVTLYRGDCLDILPTLTGIDAVVTDPPYGIGRVWKGGFGHGWGQARELAPSRNEWDAKPPTPETFAALLAVGDVHLFWGGNYFPLPLSRGWLVWTKPERGFSLSEAELAWTSRDMPMRVCDYRRSDADRTHPTQKPLGVMSWCLETVRVPVGALVLDPYMGSGTTGVACIRTGRKFIGIEIDPTHYATACKRIDNELQQMTIPMEATP